MGESRRDGRDRGNTPIIVNLRRRGEWPARNVLGSTNLWPSERRVRRCRAIDRQVESGARRTRK
ncbi:hypothetical protein BJV78DRAFT_1198111 [Lactifluus subvellereus]|nr:hypothetical protein BJV78DRAFT_1198111 [Lactifluus subvellereus]